MKYFCVLPGAFTLVLYLGLPAFAQHGGRGFGGSFGKAPLGMPRASTGEWKGNPGKEFNSPAGEGSNSETLKRISPATGKKTTGELLQQNTKLSSNLQGLLPSGTNIQDAAKGFDHLGEFVAATHVAHNLGIPFDQLKSEMMSGSSLGQAIHKLKPNVDARQEAIKANQQALDDMAKSMGSNKAARASVQ